MQVSSSTSCSICSSTFWYTYMKILIISEILYKCVWWRREPWSRWSSNINSLKLCFGLKVSIMIRLHWHDRKGLCSCFWSIWIKYALNPRSVTTLRFTNIIHFRFKLIVLSGIDFNSRIYKRMLCFWSIKFLLIVSSWSFGCFASSLT